MGAVALSRCGRVQWSDGSCRRDQVPRRPVKDGPTRKWVLSGPTCDSFDVISNEVELPDLDVGDRVYITSAGAYTTAYASEFDGFPIPAIHFLE